MPTPSRRLCAQVQASLMTQMHLEIQILISLFIISVIVPFLSTHTKLSVVRSGTAAVSLRNSRRAFQVRFPPNFSSTRISHARQFHFWLWFPKLLHMHTLSLAGSAILLCTPVQGSHCQGEGRSLQGPQVLPNASRKSEAQPGRW